MSMFSGGMDLGFSPPMSAFARPNSFGGIDVMIVDAQTQARTPRDVPVCWVRPRCPPKREGRRGTRKQWKRRRSNWPHMVFAYREPTDMLKVGNRVIATEKQWAALRQALSQQHGPTEDNRT